MVFFTTLIILNQQMVYCIFTKYRNILTFVVFLTIILGLINMNYGLQNFVQYAGEISIGCVVSLFGVTFYLYVNAALTNINLDRSANLGQIIQEKKTTQLYQEILNNLEEGIILYRKNEIDFKNEVFTNMMHRLKLHKSQTVEKTNKTYDRDKNEDIQKLKFLKIYRQPDDQSEDDQTIYNLQEILQKSQNFLNDKVFEINVEHIDDAPEFKYVHLKIKKIKNERTLIQLIDMSDKMLYNEVKAE